MAIQDYTYAQIKELPDDQKALVLRELKNLFPVNTDLAKHLGVAPVVTSNLIGKWVDGKQMGRKAMTPEERAQKKAERDLKKQQEALAQQMANSEPSNVVPQPNIPTAVVVPAVRETIQSNGGSFSIKLTKDIAGEEATTILNGIAGTLLRENKYKVSLMVEEV